MIKRSVKPGVPSSSRTRRIVPEVALFQFSTEVRVRLPETDAMGIVFHGCFFTYLDVGRTDYLRNLGLVDGVRPIKGFSNLVRHVQCDFLSPARFDDPLVIHVRLAAIGITSFRFEFLIRHRQENRVVAWGESVHVAIEEGTMHPMAVPDSFRDLTRAFEKGHLVEYQHSAA
jgi:acyl-CoA thioester hydrolase